MHIDMPRWIFASVSKHFNSKRGSIPMLFEGQRMPERQQYNDLFEFRLDGPYEKPLTKTDTYLYFEVNILIQSKITDTDFHKIHRLAGQVANMFDKCIPIYRYGDGGSLIDIAVLKIDDSAKNHIEISHFGQIEASTELLQSTVEGHYEMLLQE